MQAIDIAWRQRVVAGALDLAVLVERQADASPACPVPARHYGGPSVGLRGPPLRRPCRGAMLPRTRGRPPARLWRPRESARALAAASRKLFFLRHPAPAGVTAFPGRVPSPG